MQTNTKKIELASLYSELVLLKKLILAMKQDMEDRFLTAEEEIALEESLEEHNHGRTVSLGQLKKELCLN